MVFLPSNISFGIMEAMTSFRVGSVGSTAKISVAAERLNSNVLDI